MNEVFKPYSESYYRRDIQGVRAIGAILIIIYHIWVQKVSGGVDVFFVMSGYLMASLLLREYAKEGRISPFKFWGRIVKRVAPSAYVVLLVTLLFCLFFIPAPLWKSVVNDFIVSALHIENFQLIRLGTDYLARESPPSPFQQFWALSMQMQFYAGLPLLLSAAFYFSSRVNSLRPLAFVVVAIFIASFGYSVYSTATMPVTAYFNTAARAWEFFAGAMVALMLPFLTVGRRLSNALAWTGVLLLLGSGVFIPSEQKFPGAVALIPVLAAVFIIVSDAKGSGKNIVNKVLSSRYLVVLGEASFTIYLWHWPIFVFLQNYYETTSLDLSQGLLVVVLSLIMAFFTTKVVERPLRSLPSQKPMLAFLAGICFFLPAIAAGMGARTYVFSLYDQVNHLNKLSVNEYLWENEIAIQDDASGVTLGQFVAIKNDLAEVYRNACHAGMTEDDVIQCEFGDETADTVVVLVGGSHAAQWGAVFAELGKRQGFRLVNMTKSDCALGYLEWMNDSCRIWNENVISEIESVAPDLVITNSTRSDRLQASGHIEYVPAAYAEQWQKITRLGIPVLGIRDNPWFRQDPVSCVWKNRNNASQCSRARDEVLLPVNPAESFEKSIPQFHSVDFSQLFCKGNSCPVYFNGKLMWRDSHHLANSYMRYITLGVGETLAEQAPYASRVLAAIPRVSG